MPKPSVLFFCNFPPPYTGQTIGTEVVYRLLEGPFDTERLNTSDGALNLSRRGLARVRRATALLGMTRRLVRQLRRVRPQVLYIVPSTSWAGILRDTVYVVRARSRVGRIVAHVRSGELHEKYSSVWLRPLTRALVERIDAFLFLSSELSARSSGCIPRHKHFVVPNTIDEDLRLTDEEVEAKLRARSVRDELRVIYVGNLIPSKGYMDLVRSIPFYLAGSRVPIVVELVGSWISPQDRLRFERFVDEKGLAAHVRTFGPLSNRKAIKQLLQDADVLVLPTYYPVEAQPRSIIEAMNAATPIVATAHASIPDYVHDDINGYLVGRESPQEIARALIRLTDSVEWEKKARAARRTYEREFGPEMVTSKLVAAILGQRGSAVQ